MSTSPNNRNDDYATDFPPLEVRTLVEKKETHFHPKRKHAQRDKGAAISFFLSEVCACPLLSIRHSQ